MVTTTTYGTWLPRDMRGYVENGIILPGDPKRLDHARRLMKSDPVYLSADEQEIVFDLLKRAADEFHYTLLAVSIESWHAHWLIDHGFDAVSVMVGRLKTRTRQALDRGRIWTAGYDERYCFNQGAIGGRRTYIRRHHGWRQRPGEPPRTDPRQPSAPPMATLATHSQHQVLPRSACAGAPPHPR